MSSHDEGAVVVSLADLICSDPSARDLQGREDLGFFGDLSGSKLVQFFLYAMDDQLVSASHYDLSGGIQVNDHARFPGQEDLVRSILKGENFSLEKQSEFFEHALRQFPSIHSNERPRGQPSF